MNPLEVFNYIVWALLAATLFIWVFLAYLSSQPIRKPLMALIGFLVFSLIVGIGREADARKALINTQGNNNTISAIGCKE